MKSTFFYVYYNTNSHLMKLKPTSLSTFKKYSEKVKENKS